MGWYLMAKGSVNGSCSITSQTDDKYTLKCSGSFTFGDWYYYGVRVTCYINGSQVATATGYTTSSYQTCASCNGTLDITRTDVDQTIKWEVKSSSETVSGYGGIGESDSVSGIIVVPAKASPPPITCTIIYNANGGSGAPASQTHIYDSTSILSSIKPTKDNYAFLGWSDSNTATTSTWLARGKYINNNFSDGSTITLYAVWKRIYNFYFNIPNDKSLKNIHFKVPDNQSLKNIYFNVPE